MDSLIQGLFLSGYPSSFYWLYPCILWSQLSLLKCTAASWAHLYYLIWGTCLKIYCICLHLLSLYLSNQFLSRFSETFRKNCLVLLYQVLFLFWILFFCWFVPISMHVLLLFFFSLLETTWPLYLFLLYTQNIIKPNTLVRLGLCLYTEIPTNIKPNLYELQCPCWKKDHKCKKLPIIWNLRYWFL